MLKIMIILALTGAGFSAHAADVLRTIQDFSIVRTGGGSAVISVTANSATDPKKVVAVTTVCDFHPLSAVDQAKTAFVLSGAMATEALAILRDQATLAEKVLLKPVLPTGTFVSLTVDYIDMPSRTLNAQTINNPIVLLGGQESEVLAEIETAARKVWMAAGVCN